MSQSRQRKKKQRIVVIVIVLIVIGMFLLSRTRQATRVDERHVLTRP